MLFPLILYNCQIINFKEIYFLFNNNKTNVKIRILLFILNKFYFFIIKIKVHF